MNQPVLSIVICTHNRDSYLRNCLHHLTKQTFLHSNFEVIVVNNASTDGTEEVCSRFREQHPKILFHHIPESRQGLSYSRNRGVAESRGLVISFIDDDAYAEKDFATNLVRYFEMHPEVDAIGGKITPLYENQGPDWMSKYLLPLVAALDLGDSAKSFKRGQFPIGANMAFRRASLPDPEPFHTGLGRKGSFLGSGEEKDLFYRLRQQGKIIHYVPDVRVQHFIPERRLETGYIKRMAEGIGKSEALRIQNAPVYQILGKWLLEFLKIGATIILATLYAITGKWPKARMLVNFRFWLFNSFIKA